MIQSRQMPILLLLEQISFIESVYCERKWWVLTARQNWEHFLHSVITVFLLLKFEQRKELANNQICMYIHKGRNVMLWIKSWLVDRAHCPPFSVYCIVACTWSHSIKRGGSTKFPFTMTDPQISHKCPWFLSNSHESPQRWVPWPLSFVHSTAVGYCIQK